MNYKSALKSALKFVYSIFGINLQKDFVFLFYYNEGNILLGKRLVNFWFLIIIFFLTFFAIGFANGSLEYLGEKMDDPFIKWITIKVPRAKTERIDLIIQELGEDTLGKNKFYFNSITGYNFFTLNFFDKDRDDIISVYGRTIEPENPLLEQIMNEGKIRGRSFKDKKDYGLIVTKRILQKLNYDVDDPYICMAFGDQNEDRRIVLPVIAVVEELPGMTDFICTSYFYNQREKEVSDGNPFLPSIQRGISLLILEDKEIVSKLREKLNEFKDTNQFLQPFDLFVSNPEPNTLFYRPCFEISVTFFEDTSMGIRDDIYNCIIESQLFEGLDFIRFYDYTKKLTMSRFSNQFDRISVEFPNLDNIKGFKAYLAEEHEIDIDMAEIESRENYNFVAKLTRIISIILMIFSILSICLYISNLLRNHLEKIKMNIGTFLAFGIDNRALERIYLSIICYVLVSTMTLGLMASWLIGSIGSISFGLDILGIKIEENQTYFSQFSWWTICLIGIVMIISYLVIKQITNKIFKQTPGDLLYERV